MHSLSLHERTWRTEGTKGHGGDRWGQLTDGLPTPLWAAAQVTAQCCGTPTRSGMWGDRGTPLYLVPYSSREAPAQRPAPNQHRDRARTQEGASRGGDTDTPQCPDPQGGSSALPAKGVAREGGDTAGERGLWSPLAVPERGQQAAWPTRILVLTCSYYMFCVPCPPAQFQHGDSIQAGQEAGKSGVTPQDTPPCTFGGWQLETWGQS